MCRNRQIIISWMPGYHTLCSKNIRSPWFNVETSSKNSVCLQSDVLSRKMITDQTTCIHADGLPSPLGWFIWSWHFTSFQGVLLVSIQVMQATLVSFWIALHAGVYTWEEMERTVFSYWWYYGQLVTPQIIIRLLHGSGSKNRRTYVDTQNCSKIECHGSGSSYKDWSLMMRCCWFYSI